MAAVAEGKGERAAEVEKVWARQLSEASTAAPHGGGEGSDRDSETETETVEAEQTLDPTAHGARTKQNQGADEGAALLIAMLLLVVGLVLGRANLPSGLMMSLLGIVAVEGGCLIWLPSVKAWAGCALVPLYVCCCAVFFACQTPQL